MNQNSIYVVIVADCIIQRRLGELFIEALSKHDLRVVASPKPGLPTYLESPYNRERMRFQFSEHALRVPIKMDERHTPADDIVTPPIPDTPFHDQIFISVVGAIHSGKTAVIRELEAALLTDEIPADRISRFTLDYPRDDVQLSAEDNATCIANMRAREVVLLFHPPRRMTHMRDVFINSNYQIPATEQS